MSLALSLNLLLAASAIWAEPSHVDPGAGFVAGRSAETARVYGARGEVVSFWAVVEAGRKAIAGLQPAPGSPGRGFDAPAIWQVSVIPVRSGEHSPRPVLDRLAPPAPQDVARDARAPYWVSYRIPPGAPAGVEMGEIRFETATRQSLRLPVRIEVFDFTLPVTGRYPLLAPLDRGALRAAFGWGDALADWRGVYDLLGAYGLAPVLWDDGALFQSDAAREAVAHAAYALRAAGAPVVDLGGSGVTPKLLQPSRALLSRADAARLGPVRDGLVAENCAEQAVVRYGVPASRGDWPAFTALLEQHAARAPEIARVIAGPLAYPLLGHAEAWAVPYRDLTLTLGDVLARPAQGTQGRLPVQLVQAVASGRWQGYDTLPSDAFDGSIFTGWVPPAGRDDAFLEAQLPGPAEVSSLQIVWLGAHAARDIEVSTSRDGFRYTRATVDWEISPARPELGQPATHRGRFKYAQTVLGLRFKFARPAVVDGPIGVAEVTLPEIAPAAPEAEPRSPVRVWTTIEAAAFPAPMPGFSPAAAILLPWWCRARGAEAAVLPGFNPAAGMDPEAGIDAAAGARVLVWPVAGGLAPSVRLERIREGQQSHGYAALAKAAGITGDWVTRMPEAFQAIALGQVPDGAALDALMENYVAWRIAAGRVLGEHARAAAEEAP